MIEWQPIETAPKDDNPVLLGLVGWTPVIAAWMGDSQAASHWCEYLGGNFYGTKPPFEPSHWMPLPNPPSVK